MTAKTDPTRARAVAEAEISTVRLSDPASYNPREKMPVVHRNGQELPWQDL